MTASRTVLLGIPEVQKELALDDQQTQQVEELLADLREQVRASFGNFDMEEIRNLSREEREKRFAEARQVTEKVGKQADEKVGKILDTKQLQRLGQLQVQRAGIGALSRPKVAEYLGLTKDQQAQMRKIQEDARPQFGGQNQSSEDRRAAFARMREGREKMQADILAVLTDEQKQKWDEMKGEAFEFPRRQGFGGGGGRGNTGRRPRRPTQSGDQ